MNRNPTVSSASRSRFNARAAFVRAVLVAAGINYALVGLALLFAPEWFYQHIGFFPPFNRHYTGDNGSFILPIGLALLWAARQPARHRLMIGYAALASLIHALNHGYDDLQAGLSLTGWLTSQTAILLVFALFLMAAWWLSLQPRHHTATSPLRLLSRAQSISARTESE